MKNNERIIKIKNGAIASDNEVINSEEIIINKKNKLILHLKPLQEK